MKKIDKDWMKYLNLYGKVLYMYSVMFDERIELRGKHVKKKYKGRII